MQLKSETNRQRKPTSMGLDDELRSLQSKKKAPERSSQSQKTMQNKAKVMSTERATRKAFIRHIC